jgi:hypothetical protein
MICPDKEGPTVQADINVICQSQGVLRQPTPRSRQIAASTVVSQSWKELSGISINPEDFLKTARIRKGPLTR